MPEQPNAAPAVDPALRETAQSAWTFGLLALGLAMLAPCSSQMTLLAALPLGLVAVNRARAILESPTAVDEATQVYAQTGRVAGLGAAIYSGLMLVFFLAFILLYVSLFAAMFGAAIAVTPPPPPLPVP